MKRFLATVLMAAAGSAGLGVTAYAQRACVPVVAAQMQAQTASARNGGAAIVLSGDQAERFLDYINEDVGRHTDYWGDGVIIGRFPALGFDSIALVDDGCVDESKVIRLNPVATSGGLHAAETGSF